MRIPLPLIYTAIGGLLYFKMARDLNNTYRKRRIDYLNCVLSGAKEVESSGMGVVAISCKEKANADYPYPITVSLGMIYTTLPILFLLAKAIRR